MIATLVKKPALASHLRAFALAYVLFAALAFTERQAHAQAPDGLLNGAVIGAVVGTGRDRGGCRVYAVRDSDLGVRQYAYGALVFGTIGAGVGIGVDALLNHAAAGPRATARRVLIAPTLWRDVASVRVKWRW